MEDIILSSTVMWPKHEIHIDIHSITLLTNVNLLQKFLSWAILQLIPFSNLGILSNLIRCSNPPIWSSFGFILIDRYVLIDRITNSDPVIEKFKCFVKTTFYHFNDKAENFGRKNTEKRWVIFHRCLVFS